MEKSKRLLIALSSFQRTKSIERNNLSKPSKNVFPKLFLELFTLTCAIPEVLTVIFL